ncbi:hypothetical protein OO013_07900 [Mangrovivirga sp. M17]|uniref:Restriction endonuclease type IV Mrr domain-containing protein n=1 Tax=Mangrovivirga halotolerans TaxID=2993936 RepID=A0ABT3RPR1_9BACT|nr:hypothetical protein [Mangrovivirga halotolerans]MCX2743783.1 hypothetical protein [Mangrovivirga halotolerans]
MIFGDKSDFAIEYTPEPGSQDMGYGKIWIKGEFYGTNEDLIYPSYIINIIRNLLQAKQFQLDWKKFSNTELLSHLNSIRNSDSSIIISSSTFTDDFEGFKFKSGNEIIIVWRLISDENDLLFEELRNYNRTVKIKTVDIQSITSVYEEFKRQMK